jgi:hypothetical protein
MGNRDTSDVTRWLEAEAAGSTDEADANFAGLFGRHVPPLDVPAGLQNRILLSVVSRRGAFDPAAWRWGRAAVAALLAVIGVALATASPDLLLDGLVAAAGLGAHAAHWVTVSATAAAGVALACWDLMTVFARATVLVVTTGRAPLVIAANVLLAVTSFCGLKRLLAPREECA